MKGKKPKKDRPPLAEFSYRVQDILRRRDRLAAVLLHEFEGKIIEEGRFDRLVDLVVEDLPAGLDYETIRASLVHLAGMPLSRARIVATCHLLAGNLPRLAAHKVVHPWTNQLFDEWVPLHIASCRRYRTRRFKVGGVFIFKVMAGTPAGWLIENWWSLKYCRWIAPKLGFSNIYRHDDRYPFRAVEQFVGLRMEGCVQVVLSDEGAPKFRSVRFTSPALRNWNREKLRLRFRVDPGYTCPIGNPVSFACHRCPIGYLQCPAGTHAQNWIVQACDTCGEPQAIFDPEFSGYPCVNCIRTYRKQEG